MGGLIGLDWGTSSLRAWHFDDAGGLREARERPWGIRKLPAGGFDAALATITKGWPDVPRLACGMVGSRGGWREVPYVELPADGAQLARHLDSVQAADGQRLYLVPGLRGARGPEVMRGEETQLLGALAVDGAPATRSTWVLPGTHSKWVATHGTTIEDFQTYLSGELYALLRERSILGEGAEEDGEDLDAFTRGVIAAREAGTSGGFSRLFSARTLVLEGQLAPTAVADYLSGLVIGEEWRSALAGGRFDVAQPVCLIGTQDLCARYRRAAACFDVAVGDALEQAAAHGLWHIARQAGLIDAVQSTPSARACR